MERIEDGSALIEAQNKPRWRAPKLVADKIGQVTEQDYTAVGNDGGSHAHGFFS